MSFDFPKWLQNLFIYSLRLLEKTKLYTIQNYKKPSFIISSIGILSIGYIIIPTVSSFIFGQKEINRATVTRPDKYTTGLKNTANDCFANSTIQSLVPLCKLNEYFTKVANYHLPKNAIKYPLPFHLSMINMLTTLQEPIYSQRVLSVWDLLHLLEQIHHGKISRNQQDAHELLLMFINTLEDEYIKFFSFVSKLEEDEKKEIEQPPHFPFSSIVESKLKCMKCKHSSVPVKTPMLMLELITPQSTSSATLENIISNNQSEIIEEYSCFICMIKFVILNQNKLTLTAEQVDFIQKMKSKLIEGDLTINDEYMEDPLYKGIISTNLNLRQSNLKSIVHRETNFMKAPEILPIHLSRSIYTDSQSWRNGCTITFPIEIKITTTNISVPNIYRLKSVIRHKGTHSSGHYECYRRKPQFYKTIDGKYVNDFPKIEFNKDQLPLVDDADNNIPPKSKKLASVFKKPFWRISDSKVIEVTEDTVLGDGRNVYMLIYECIN